MGPCELDVLLSRSAELESAIAELFNLSLFDASNRYEASKTFCGISFEHAESVKILLAAGNFTSAIGLLRLQYEAFVRAMWLFYAAAEKAVAVLTSELTAVSAKQADGLPMLSAMLGQLEGKAPIAAIDQLLEFKEYSWKPLSSFIHGGLHAANRHSQGYPAPLLAQALKASNGVCGMTGQLLIILAGDPRNLGRITAISKEYADCLPIPRRGS